MRRLEAKANGTDEAGDSAFIRSKVVRTVLVNKHTDQVGGRQTR